MAEEITDLIIFSETDADIANDIYTNELSKIKYCASAKELEHFSTNIQQYRSGKGDASTNIIDQGKKVSYSIDDNSYYTLMDILEKCRQTGIPTHWSERQFINNVEHSGIMLDFDVLTHNNNVTLTEDTSMRLASVIFQKLQMELKFPPTTSKHHIFFINKPRPVFKHAEGGKNVYKYGFHVLIPSLCVKKSYKKWLCKELSDFSPILKVMSNMGAIAPNSCLDQNSASVPVLFIGSCKSGSIPYYLSNVYEITVDNSCPDFISLPFISVVKPEVLSRYNIVSEASLIKPAKYKNNIQPLVDKIIIEPKDEIAQQSESWNIRAADDDSNREELSNTDISLKNLVVQDAEARYLHALLDILPEEYSTDFIKWRNTIFAIANTSHTYEILAIWFSQKCASKWLAGGKEKLKTLWHEAINSTQEARLSQKSIVYWAKQANPEGFERISKKSVFNVLLQDIYNFEGELLECRVAKVLYMLLKQKYCTDVVRTATSEKYMWYEFVTPSADNLPGENWKWREEISPCNLVRFISDNFANIVTTIKQDLERQYLDSSGKKKKKSKDGEDDEEASADDADKQAFYSKLKKALDKSLKNLQRSLFKRNVIDEAKTIFRVRGFAANLNKTPHLFGVANGVLDLSIEPKLINYYHEYPISKFSNVNYRPFDPTNPMTKKALKAIEDIIIEQDARDWILFHAAQALHSGPKEGIILYWIGGGQNGKTTFLRWIAKALGPYAEKFNVQLLCNEREDADKANSAIMRFKDLNFAYAEETNKSERINPARLKELVNSGEVSGRELHKSQESFTMHANLIVATQYSLSMPCNDHAVWRRQYKYDSKVKYRENPDPNNPYEKKDDASFNRTLPDDPEFQSSILSILVHYYWRLQKEYDGQLKKVVSPTIQNETEEYRKSQDIIHRWISIAVVVTAPRVPDENGDMPTEIIYHMDELSRLFSEWYVKNFDHKTPSASDIITDLKISALSRFLKPMDGGLVVLKGCRVMYNNFTIMPGEERLVTYIMRGNKTTEEWEQACAKSAEMSKKTNWWEY
jgi:phage/plasmid-associated DNA primase